jgi:hypothetical protein
MNFALLFAVITEDNFIGFLISNSETRVAANSDSRTFCVVKAVQTIAGVKLV